MEKAKNHGEEWEESYKIINGKWVEFIKKNTSLNYKEKSQILKILKRSRKIPWYFLFKSIFSPKLRDKKSKFKDLKKQITSYNDNFIKNRLVEYESFLNGTDDGLKYPLDAEQRIAVIKDDLHNLVIAGAGSGKTSVLTTRIAYLIRRKDKVEPERILALAFARVAADEMESRLSKDYNLKVKISTFHALGRKIIREETNKKPRLLFNGSEVERGDLIAGFYNNLLETDGNFQVSLISYMAYHYEQEIEEDSFNDKELYYRYMQNKNYSTLTNIEVKSISERNIGNFLFLNGIEFQYEPLVDWSDNVIDENENDDREYHPDFFLPNFGIYIEHWGLNEKGEVPGWFTVTSKEYNESRNWKLGQFEKHNKILVQTWEYERFNGNLIENLKKKLVEINPGIKFELLPFESVVEKCHNFKGERKEIEKLIISFINIAKSNFLTEKDIADRLKSKKYKIKQRIFGKMALEVYKKYQSYLKEQNKIDFNDMINLAVTFAQNNPEKYANMYDHILVDEFQDISYQRMELIKCFVNENSNTKLFCVGDDWQSIYQFTGSDVGYFINFKKHFAEPEISHLSNNYRSSQNIVNISNNLIKNNKDQVTKTVRSTNDIGQIPLFFELSEEFGYSFKARIPHIFNLINLLITEGVSPGEIMVLSRFNKNLKDLEIYCGANGIPTESKHGGIRFYSAHRSKGSESEHVIVIDVIDDFYGFPCERQDSSVMEPAKRNKSKNFIEEERRLFYVALTRSKNFLYLFGIENKNSMFLGEIERDLMKFQIDSVRNWEEFLSNYLSKFIKGEKITSPIKCPVCGKFLKEREGKHGKFLGCTGYPNCSYIYNIPDNKSIPCPSCGKKLIVRTGTYGKFLGCLGYPGCKFTYNLSLKTKNSIYCPICQNRLGVRKGPRGIFIGCNSYPQCKFTFELKNIN